MYDYRFAVGGSIELILEETRTQCFKENQTAMSKCTTICTGLTCLL